MYVCAREGGKERWEGRGGGELRERERGNLYGSFVPRINNIIMITC